MKTYYLIRVWTRPSENNPLFPDGEAFYYYGKGGQLLMTADHGNADEMIDKDGGPMTAHSLNKVPLVHIAENFCAQFLCH